jgi:hypothetical protein
MSIFGDRSAAFLYLAIAGLVAVTYFGGTYGLSAVRWVYLLGCAAVAVQALRLGTGYHFEALISLFAFSPFLRRIVDYSCGFDERGLMLTGPLLAALVPTTSLPAAILAKRGRLVGRLGPYVLITICLGYAALVSELNGSYYSSVVGLGKSVSVLLYGCWLIGAADDPGLVMRHGARAFMLTMPIVGVYGIAQYLDPSPADCYWMISTDMSSIGRPEPEQVRVFSTLNSPASLGNFLVFGLIFVGFLRRPWEALICAVPGAMALLLSQSRTAWISFAVSIIYTFFFTKTKSRSGILGLAIVVCGVCAVLATPFGDVISARLQTFSVAPGNDGSAMERLDEYRFLFEHLDMYLFGSGPAGPSGTGWGRATLALAASDGLVVQSISAMGVFGAFFLVTGLIWVALQAILRVERRAAPEFVIAAALALGQVVTIPLGNPIGAEFGVLFWSAVAIASRAPSLRLNRRGVPTCPVRPAPPLRWSA